MRAVDTGIYNLLNADSTLVSTHGSNGAYRIQAPQGESLPVVIFQEQSGIDDYVFGGGRDHSLVYLVKAVDQGLSGSTAEQMHERIDTLMTDGALAVSGYTVLRVRRESTIVYTENVEGITYQHVGGLYRIDLEV